MKWKIARGSGDWYTIQASGEGVTGENTYLGANEDGSSIVLSEEASNQRYRWTIIERAGGSYSIKIQGGVSGDKAFLSADVDGGKLDLVTNDDGSGRQKWRIPKMCPPKQIYTITDTPANSCPDGEVLSEAECESAAN